VSDSLHIGLIVNPLAGIGGALALKGSDGDAVRALAAELGPEGRKRALTRVLRALAPLAQAGDTVRFSAWAGEMGERALRESALSGEILGRAPGGLTSAADTREAARAMLAAGVDIILFAGGDGTARDLCDVVGESFPVLGIPAGVKMHSGVFAVSPEAAGELLLQLAQGGLVGLKAQEVRDIDEEAFRHDVVRSRFYGDMLVPGEGRYLQHTKVGGVESQELVAAEIAAWLVENMEAGRTYLIGPGSTTAAIMEALDLPNTLLGVDAVRDGVLLASDADEAALLALLAAAEGGAAIVVTVIGGQGYLFGRGNQQFSPRVIRDVGLENIIVVAAKSKIAALEGRPLLVDTDDPALDAELSGYRAVLTGYDDRILYRVATDGGEPDRIAESS
jgi:predicted polyphosphate/ATP-dependent NAD kinase